MYRTGRGEQIHETGLFRDSITSRTEGYDRPLLTIKLASKLGEEWEVINAGVPGNNTFDAIERIQTDVLSHNPDLVTVLFGANDAAHHKRVQLLDYKRNLTDIDKSWPPFRRTRL
ncbi:GDSL-type esterase/lipase family protein [Paenibacillus chondroitinus]